MGVMEWKRHTKGSQTAQEIASYSGQNVDQVRSLVTARDTYAVITWVAGKRNWELWERTPTELDDRYWVRRNSFITAAEAKVYAETVESERLVLVEVRKMPEGVKLTVIAEWQEPYHGTVPLRLACRSAGTAEAIASVMKRLGCTVTTEIDQAA